MASIRDYDATGQMLGQSPRDWDPFGFTGGLGSGDGLWKLGARFYDSGKNLFIQQDRYMGDSKDPLSLNRYVYCGLDPVNLNDPTGHSPLLIAFGACIGVCVFTPPDSTFGQLVTNAVTGMFVAAGLQEFAAAFQFYRMMQTAPAEVEVGTKVYRVWGDGSGPYGKSWTRVNPSTVDNYRNAAGLPDVNSGRFLSEGIITKTKGIKITSATALDGNSGGLDEVWIPNALKQVKLTNVSGINPEY